MAGALLLAHQGGWDEALFVLAPLLLFAGLLIVARRRVDQMDADEPRSGPASSSEPTTGAAEVDAPTDDGTQDSA